jgi:hypothetical protein
VIHLRSGLRKLLPLTGAAAAAATLEAFGLFKTDASFAKVGG